MSVDGVASQGYSAAPNTDAHLVMLVPTRNTAKNTQKTVCFAVTERNIFRSLKKLDAQKCI